MTGGRSDSTAVLDSASSFLENLKLYNLLIGVDDERNVIGLAQDYKLFGKKRFARCLRKLSHDFAAEQLR